MELSLFVNEEKIVQNHTFQYMLHSSFPFGRNSFVQGWGGGISSMNSKWEGWKEYLFSSFVFHNIAIHFIMRIQFLMLYKISSLTNRYCFQQIKNMVIGIYNSFSHHLCITDTYNKFLTYLLITNCQFIHHTNLNYMI